MGCALLCAPCSFLPKRMEVEEDGAEQGTLCSHMFRVARSVEMPVMSLSQVLPGRDMAAASQGGQTTCPRHVIWPHEVPAMLDGILAV